jgi:hypothetical protein
MMKRLLALIAFVLWAAPVQAQLTTPNELAKNEDPSPRDGTGYYETASFSPSANSIVLVSLHTLHTGGVTGLAISGFSASWTSVAAINYGTIASPARRLEIFKAEFGSTPGTDTIRFTVSSLVGSAQWRVIELTGYDTSTPILQAPTNRGNATANPETFTVSTSAYTTGSTAIFFVGFSGTGGTITVEGGWSAIGVRANNEISGWAAYDTTPTDTTPSMSFNAARDWGAIAVEVAAAGGEPPPEGNLGTPEAVTNGAGTDATDKTDGQTYVTTSHTIAANSLIIFAAVFTGTTTPPTVTGHGLSWSTAVSRTFFTAATSSMVLRVYYAQTGGSPSTDAITMTVSGTATGAAWQTYRQTGFQTTYPIYEAVGTAVNTELTDISVGVGEQGHAFNDVMAFVVAPGTGTTVAHRADYANLGTTQTLNQTDDRYDVQLFQAGYAVTFPTDSLYEGTLSAAQYYGAVTVQINDAASSGGGSVGRRMLLLGVGSPR